MELLQHSFQESIDAATSFDEAHYAHDPLDSFYSAPPASAFAEPGTLLRTESITDSTKYSLPPGTALSRIIYQSKTLMGCAVPVSAAILWPYAPRTAVDGKFLALAWAHGTTGISSHCAPSNMKNLWQHYLGPFALVLQGYVVICTDYSGLGIGADTSGKIITHEYLCGISQAHDVFYSVQAAQAAFPQIGENFIVIGHSQGGGAAWGCAQRQAIDSVQGYLGAVAISPVTQIMNEVDEMAEVVTAVCVPGIEAAFPKFDRQGVLSDEGMQTIDLIRSVHANEPLITLLTKGRKSLLRDEWREDISVKAYHELAQNGGQNISGPLLVIIGSADDVLSEDVCVKAVKDTARRFPNAKIELFRLPGVSHIASLTASQSIWIKWIEERFALVPTPSGLTSTTVTSARETASYSQEMTWYLETKTNFFQSM